MAKILVKDNVAKAIVIIAAVANEAALLDVPTSVVITSVSDGTHSRNSRHYFGEAVDVRSKNFHSRAAKLLFLRRVLNRLGPGYQGILEGEGTPNEHFHLEYDLR
jgi:hypothetical protein